MGCFSNLFPHTNKFIGLHGEGGEADVSSIDANTLQLKIEYRFLVTTAKEKVQHYGESVKQNVTFHSNPIRNKQTSCYVEKHPSANYEGKQMSQKKLHFFFKCIYLQYTKLTQEAALYWT